VVALGVQVPLGRRRRVARRTAGSLGLWFNSTCVQDVSVRRGSRPPRSPTPLHGSGKTAATKASTPRLAFPSAQVQPQSAPRPIALKIVVYLVFGLLLGLTRNASHVNSADIVDRPGPSASARCFAAVVYWSGCLALLRYLLDSGIFPPSIINFARLFQAFVVPTHKSTHIEIG
jgi:hypothetical protein